MSVLKPDKKDMGVVVDEVPKGQESEEKQEPRSRRDFLKKTAMLGGAAGLAGLLGGYGLRDAQGAPGAGASGTTISDEDVDAKRIAGVRIATEFITGTVPAGTDADPYPGACIQAAIDDLPTTGGTVFIPEGTYAITTGLTVTDGSNVTIEGTGRGTILRNDGSNDTLIVGDGTAQEGFVLSDVRLSLPTASAVVALRLRSQRHSILNNIRIFGNAATLNQTGIRVEGVGSVGTWNNLILHPIIGFCLIGIDVFGLTAAKANAITIFGGTVVGHSSLPAGSVGVRFEEGDTLQVFGLDIEQFDTGMEFNTLGRQSSVHGLRIEQANTGISVTDFGAQNNRFFGGILFSTVTTPLANSGGASIRFVNMDGLVTKNRGTGVILNTASSVVVAHGLHTTPDIVLLTGSHTEVKDAYVTSPGGTNFTITVDSPVTANRNVDWVAQTIYRT